MGRNLGAVPSSWGGELGPHKGELGSWSPYSTMWPGLRPTSIPSGILMHPALWPQLIHPTVWLQYTTVTDRTEDRTHRQRSDSIWRTVWQMVAQKLLNRKLQETHTVSLSHMLISWSVHICASKSLITWRVATLFWHFGLETAQLRIAQRIIFYQLWTFCHFAFVNYASQDPRGQTNTQTNYI